MIGAIIGDIVGSRFEFDNYRHKDFELFTDECFFTDDTVMTLAVAKTIMEYEKNVDQFGGLTQNQYDYLGDYALIWMRDIARKYPNSGYGGMFYDWVFSENPMPYNSYGNGAAMRISPIAYHLYSSPYKGLDYKAIYKLTAITHNHEEGIKGALATCLAIKAALSGLSKEEISKRIEEEYYNLDFTIDEIRPTYQFNETSQETVPQAIVCFLESESFEDAIRIAISLGGDSDTLAAITGSIAEAYYGVPEDLKEKALSYLDDDLREIYDEWKEMHKEASWSRFL